jgi:lysophospholipid acyltransferase
MLTRLDFRRYLRPFFLDPKTAQPTAYKIYYDIFSYLATQLSFSFVVAPFVLLTLPASFLVWTRVYFYAVIGLALCYGFFASPGKILLAKKLNERAGGTGAQLKRTHSAESLAQKEPVLGLPPDPQADLEELMGEVKKEMAVRRRNSSTKKL